MVFGWGKKKSQKQEPDITPQKKQILLSDVHNMLMRYVQFEQKQ